MNSIPILFTLTFALFFLAKSSSAYDGEIRITNNCGQNLWVGYRGSSSGNFELSNGQSRTITLVGGKNGVVWGQLNCGGGGCDAGPDRISLAEMHWESNGHLWYDISQVDGYNLPITMSPYNPSSTGRCRTVNCNFNYQANCPAELKYDRGCKSNCRFNQGSGSCQQYIQKVKSVCPNVYTYPSDDAAGMSDCWNSNGINVKFC